MNMMTKAKLPIYLAPLLLGLGLLFGWAFAKWYDFAKSEESLNTPYAVYEGKTLTARDVAEHLKQDSYRQKIIDYRTKKNAVESLISKKIKDEERKKNPPADKLEISESEFQNYLVGHGLVEKKLTSAQRENILSSIRNHKRNSLQKEIEQELKKITWLLPPVYPALSLDPGAGPRKGGWRAPIQIIVVANYYCPNCHQVPQIIDELDKKYGDKLKFYFRFAISEADQSIARQSAEATYCAHNEEKFWEFNQRLLTKQNRNDAVLSETANEIGLKLEAFEKCITDRKYKSTIEKDAADIKTAGIQAIPVLIINDQSVSINTPLSDIFTLIDHELK